MTKRQKAYYLEHEGVRCPFCHSENLDCNPIEHDDVLSAVEWCETCGRRWRAFYTVTDLVEMK